MTGFYYIILYFYYLLPSTFIGFNLLYLTKFLRLMLALLIFSHSSFLIYNYLYMYLYKSHKFWGIVFLQAFIYSFSVFHFDFFFDS